MTTVNHFGIHILITFIRHLVNRSRKFISHHLFQQKDHGKQKSYRMENTNSKRYSFHYLNSKSVVKMMYRAHNPLSLRNFTSHVPFVKQDSLVQLLIISCHLLCLQIWIMHHTQCFCMLYVSPEVASVR